MRARTRIVRAALIRAVVVLSTTLCFVLAGSGCGSDGEEAVLPSGEADASSDAKVWDPLACKRAADCPAQLPHCSPEGRCVACLGSEHCAGGTLCHEHYCLSCVPGQKQCAGNESVVECLDDATGFKTVEGCPPGGICKGAKCFLCYPATKKCEGSKAYECSTNGDEWILVQDCAGGGYQCHLGVCLSPCSSDFKANTNAGCGFFAVDLDNAVQTGGGRVWDAWSAQFAVIASNTSESQDAVVTVTHPDGDKQVRQVGPLSLETFELPSVWGQDGTRRSKSAFRSQSDQPITVYQFNPLSNAGDFSSDASVLLPAGGLGRTYFVMSHPQVQEMFRGFFTVVGISQAQTQVTVTVTAKTAAGSDIPALLPGQSHTFDLAIGEVVNIETDSAGGDLTGTKVVGNGPIQVMSGHEAAQTGKWCCADHLEEQMVPVDTWGTEYVMTRSKERWAERDYFRILVAEPGTVVTVEPAVTDPATFTLDEGAFLEIATDVHFRVTATKPLMVAQYLASSYEILPGNATGPAPA